MSVRTATWLLAAAVAVLPTVVFGQDVADETGADPVVAQPRDPNAVPELNQVLDVIDKATQDENAPKNASSWSAPVRLAVVFAMLALLPSLLVLMTSFTRIIIVLGFLRRALSTQSIPPTIALIGLALFLTFYTMAPVFAEINRRAIIPYQAGELGGEHAVDVSSDLLKDFMLRQTRQNDLALFMDMAAVPSPKTQADIPMRVAVPAFAISEFRTAFEIGVLLFIPFILVDLVCGAVLLSAGMMMLPPVMVSLPFKLILFVLVDGWQLLARALVLSFH
ncbi:MAG: flagellar type III secretion system pore protein FliP [Planctomycetes bacterium]|jgi:flagellar biosynthetic protein FliP|nr:flagellar type III secretion system pore protein FliP [Planctomycetota bacterium]